MAGERKWVLLLITQHKDLFKHFFAVPLFPSFLSGGGTRMSEIDLREQPFYWDVNLMMTSRWLVSIYHSSRLYTREIRLPTSTRVPPSARIILADADNMMDLFKATVKMRCPMQFFHLWVSLAVNKDTGQEKKYNFIAGPHWKFSDVYGALLMSSESREFRKCATLLCSSEVFPYNFCYTVLLYSLVQKSRVSVTPALPRRHLIPQGLGISCTKL